MLEITPFDQISIDLAQSGMCLAIIKPMRWTSFDVVNKLRYTLKVKKIGHAGTLDPLAEGLLLICTGAYTKKIEMLQGLDKKYDGILELGKTTPSIDLETDFDHNFEWKHVTSQEIEAVKSKFLGVINQIPPIYSAIQKDGKRAYEYARANKTVELLPREIFIHNLSLSCDQLPEIFFSVHCSKGTYVRSLVRDIGKELGTGAYLKKLRRTAIGNYSIDQAYSISDILNKMSANGTDNLE